MKILRGGRREGSSFVFDEGYRFDRRGVLRLKEKQLVSSPIIRSGVFQMMGNQRSRQMN